MEDDDITLPTETLNILNEFLWQKSQREREEFENIQNKNSTRFHFEENWQLSQFWYNTETKQKLASIVFQLIQQTSGKFKVALLSCPSLYKVIKNINENVHIFEYDRRFSIYGKDFIYYDYNDSNTEGYLRDLFRQYDLVIADPPFLAEDCIIKISNIIKSILQTNGYIIFCSGESMEKYISRCLPVKKCRFRPQHDRNLANEFVSYANFDLDQFVGKDLESKMA